LNDRRTRHCHATPARIRYITQCPSLLDLRVRLHDTRRHLWRLLLLILQNNQLLWIPADHSLNVQ
jgi:hypothetical protein